MKLPNYYDSYQGLNGATRSATYVAAGSAQRNVLAIDYGLLWQATPTLSLSEQIDYSDAHQPGTTTMESVTTVATPKDTATSTGNETIFNTNLTTTNALSGAGTFEGSGSVGVPLPGQFDQRFLTNNLTASWDVSSTTVLSLTYRYRNHLIGQGIPDSDPLAVGATTNGTVTIGENGGIFNVAFRPSKNWDIDGSAEVAYADNSFTPMGPRQTKHYRVHTMFRPKSWATFTGAYNDLERHNNTNNNAAAVAANDDPYEGPLNHVDHSRIFSLAAALEPNEHYGLDFNYAYSDVYTATNICFDNGAQNASTTSSMFPGTATTNSSGGPAVCPGVFTRGSTTQLADWFGRDFMDAPTQYGSVAFTLSPVDKLHSSVGYHVSAVNGTRFFTDARDVNGSLVSTYQSPFLSLAYAIRRGWTWKAEYNFYSYGEGGPSGPQNCSFSTSLTSTVVPCASLSQQTGLTEPSSGLTAPREFHAGNVSLGMHFEF
jgi:hypothetical protein